MAQTKPKAGQFYGVSNNGTDGQFLKTDGTGGMSWDSPVTNPTLTSIDYPGSATAADPAGGESIIINGSGFQVGITCTIGGTSATTALNSATQITITSPAKTAGQYTVEVTNTDGGTASQSNFIQYSGVPIWSTASGSLGSVAEGGTASFQVTATEGSDTIEYAVTSGSLPSGLSLATATGAITGTAGAVSADTTSTFSITATDDENQTSSARSFSITVTNVAPSGQYNAKLFTGRSQNVTGFGFNPDLAWIFNRAVANGNFINDTVRGATETLWPEANYAEDTRNVVTSFITDGVTIGDYSSIGTGNNIVYGFKAGGPPTATNSAGVGNAPTAGSVMVNGVSSTSALAGTIAAKKISVNTSLGLSIVQYTGAGSAATIAHELGGIPDFIIVKNLDANEKWRVYNSYSGATKYMSLDDSYGTGTASTIWNDTTPTSTVFSVGSDASVSGNGNSFIAYLFKNTTGFTKSGGYTGNGSTNGPMIETGFKPAYLILKSTSNSGTSWRLMDSTRNPSNPVNKQLDIQDAIVESTTNGVNFYENGFQLITTDTSLNGSGYTYTYLAIAGDGSTTTPTLANSFAAEIYSGNSSTQQVTTGFKSDLVWIKARNATWNWVDFDTVRGMISPYSYRLNTNTSAAQSNWAPTAGISAADATSITILDPGGQGYGMNTSGENYVTYNWKAGGLGSINKEGTIDSIVSANQAGGFSIQTHTAPSTEQNYNIGHGLGVKPSMVILKGLDSNGTAWFVWHQDLSPESYYLYLQDNYSVSGLTQDTRIWGQQSFTTDVISMRSNYTTILGENYVSYCWADIANYQKCGSYVGNGTLGHNIAVGFAPDFVMLKMVTATGDWYMFDSKRKTGVYSDQLEVNDSAAEATGTYVELTSTGFDLNTTLSSINNSGETFIYIAIKIN